MPSEIVEKAIAVCVSCVERGPGFERASMALRIKAVRILIKHGAWDALAEVDAKLATKH